MQSVKYWFSLRIENTRVHLMGDECFFNSPDESIACAMYVRALAELGLIQRGAQEAMKHRSGEHRGLCFGERRPLAKHSLLSIDGVRRTYDGSSKRNSGAMMIDLPLPTEAFL